MTQTQTAPRQRPNAVSAAPLTVFPRWRLPRVLRRWLRGERHPVPTGRLSLARDHSIVLHDVRALSLTVYRGRVWITREGDPVDVELRAGESMHVECEGAFVALAMETSIMQFTPAPQAASARVAPVAWQHLV